MKFFLDQVETMPAEIQAQTEAYNNYLESVKGRLPLSAFTFAKASWHYDPADHRCPHDSWVESLTIKEPSSGNRQQYRSMELHLRLLGAYHDGRIEIIYKEVKGYSLSLPAVRKAPSNVGHGDWLIDEVRLSELGLVEHEIGFSQGGGWLIECADIVYEWIAFTSG